MGSNDFELRDGARKNTSLSKFLNTGVRQPLQKSNRKEKELHGHCCGSSEGSNSNSAKQATGSRSKAVKANNSVSQLSHEVLPNKTPTLTITIPSTSTPNSSPPNSFPEVFSPSGLQKQSTVGSPVRSKSKSFSAPTTPHPKHRSRSPLLGISALGTKAGSQLSLDWDNFSSCPSYFREKIPIVSTPSPSLAGSTDSLYQLSTPTSVIMAVKRCSRCHRYISGAPSAELKHTGDFGADCKGEHHPSPCNYVGKENQPCSYYVGGGNDSSRGNNSVSDDVIKDTQSLYLAMNKVNTLQRMFPVELMTLDRLTSYNQELDKITQSYMDFNEKVALFGMHHSLAEFFVTNADGKSLNVDYWNTVDQQLGLKVNEHQLKIRNKASELQSNKSMSEYEKKELEIKQRELQIKEEQLRLMKLNQSKSEQAEKEKANAVAQSKYDEILLVSEELDEVLDKVSDWSTASRSEIMTAMKSLDKWSQSFAQLNKAHRDFILATSIYPLPNESEKVEDIIQETSDKYKKITAEIISEDKKRELYSLAGSNKEQVKLPKFGGNMSEDFSTFKAKLLLALEKNMVPVSDKIEKLRSCLSGAALSLVPEKTTDFEAALETLQSAFGNPERVLSVRINEIKKVGKCPPEVLNGKRNYSAIVSFCLKVEVLIQDLLDLAEREGCEQLQYDAYSSQVRSSIQRLFNLREEKKMRALISRGKAGLEEHLKFIKQFRTDSQTMVDTVGDSREKQSGKDDTTDKQPRKSTGGQGHSHSFFKNPKRLPNCRICTVLEHDKVGGLYDNHISDTVEGCPKFQAMSAEDRRNICMRAKICMKCCDLKLNFDSRHRRECTISKRNKYIGTCVEHPDCVMHAWLCGYHQDANRQKILDFTAKFKVQPPVNTNTSSFNAKSSEDTVKVLKNMKRNLKKRGASLIPIPEGDSMFVLAPLKGKTRPVMSFFDSGCSDAVSLHGVPGSQLNGICVNEGPITCFGVGNTEIKARQEWIVKIKRKDGNYQLVQTLTMDEVCAPMPLVKTGLAVDELKKSDPSNQLLQNCCVPQEIGGKIDIILGIRYNNIAPKVIHTLESGLTIYSINLETHDSKINAAIGGTHSSFSSIVNYNGGLSKVGQSLQTLYITLENYKRYGPPSIPVFPVAKGDKSIQQFYYNSEFGSCFSTQPEFFEDLGYADSDSSLEETDNSIQEIKCEEAQVIQHTCCNVDEEYNLHDLKFWFKQVEAGTTVDYRCPDCRECIRCKNSDSTEKVSLREEVEQKLIEDSVHFDRENKKVMVNLPKRGEEEFFLSSNRDIAYKVYQKICDKASKNEEIKFEINKAFEKLFKNGHAVYLSDVPQSTLDKFMQKPVQHFLPWRLVWKADSLTTPCRPVFDASTNTRKRLDDSGGGRSLNDLLCKGRVDTLNLLKMMIRFSIGSHALTGDLQQFYCCCKLFPEEMNLTRFLYSPDLDSKTEPQECAFQALIFGLKSASAQTEFMKKKLADEIKEEYPELALLLNESTYVDDIGESKDSSECINSLSQVADKVLGELNVMVKAWTKTGCKPSEMVSDDGVSVLVGGMQWFPQLDSVSVRIPSLHFGKRRRGRLDKNTEFFAISDNENDLERLGKFCPKLTRRICASKSSSIFDIMGLLSPVLAGIKVLMSETVKSTSGWDDEISSDLQNKWLLAFLRIESLRGIQFDRPVMPVNAVDKNLRLIGLSDAAKPIIMVGIWGGFLCTDGSYSCRLIIGRSILSADTTIPKLELDGTCSVANLGWVVRSALAGWDVSYYQAADSTIALSWVMSEQLRLSEFHRNRVVQIRRAVDLNNLFHVKTELNVADCGTRPDKVKLEDVMMGSRWHNGEDWMRQPLETAIEQASITPANNLSISDSEREEYKEGIIFEKIPELLTRGHTLNRERISKLEERARFSNYIVLPTKFGFKKSFNITLLVLKFIMKCRKGKQFSSPKLSSPLKNASSIFSVSMNSGLSPNLKSQTESLFNLETMQEEEKYRNLTLTYLFRVATLEAKEFIKPETLDKIAFESNGILYAKNRILETMEFQKVSGMDHIVLEPLGINSKTPIIDRYSPLSYAFAQYVHYEVSSHAGLETCNRLSLERVFIVQGISLYRELSIECISCKIKRKRFLEMSFGPIGEHSLTVAPPFYACQADLYGPVSVYAPGAQRDLRGRPAKMCKVWSLVFVCPVTRLVNCQVVETSDHSGIVDGVTRLAAEVGFPKYLMIDQDSAVIKCLQEASVNMRNLQHNLFTERGVVFTTCPVGGHNFHGHVERVIRSIQNLLDDCDVKSKRLHATGYQTLLKLVENMYNSLPLGFSYDKSLSNTPLLKVITPNFFKMGRNNDRALDGPVYLPNGTEMIKKVESTYQALFKLWADVYVPKLIFSPKWHRDDEQLKEGDLVYLKKSPDNKLESKWVIGIVEQLLPSRDEKVRRVIVRYQNASEDTPQFTDRSVRQLVKIYDIEEYVLQDDLGELMRRLSNDRMTDEPSISQVVSQSEEGHDTANNLSVVSGTWLRRSVPSAQSTSLGASHLASQNFSLGAVPKCGDRRQVPTLNTGDSQDLTCWKRLDTSDTWTRLDASDTWTRLDAWDNGTRLDAWDFLDLPCNENMVSEELCSSFLLSNLVQRDFVSCVAKDEMIDPLGIL